ncbi:MAG: T9SS type A sorting domain-containing protein [Bacteroidales bacterium]|nr:T9SS type A sorting domain-containing protein [Bacteroidales bacterium]
MDGGAWEETVFDVSAYADGEASVQFRFSVGETDGSWLYCGWNIDDFYVFGTFVSTTPIANVSSSPSSGTGSVTVSSNMSGNQTFYLRDNSGGAITDWTGDATSHEFTGLSDGIYKGQVEKDGELSELSSSVTLTNITAPLAATSVQATETDICSGTATTLSYTGGSGTNFKWYTGSCGGTLAGTGNDFSVSPTSTTTYYGRWENACGESTCENVEIIVSNLITADAGIDINSCDATLNLAGNDPIPGTGEWSIIGGAGTITDINDPNTNITITTSPVTFRWTIYSGVCEDYDDVTITLLEATSITSQPVDVIDADLGTTVVFTVVAAGSNLMYQWLKDDSDITGETSDTYTISNVTVDDEGTYKVEVSGDCGDVTSDDAMLTVVADITTIVDLGMSVYPNPSTGQFTIEFDKIESPMEVELTDATGRIIYYGNLNEKFNHLNIGQQSSGVYLMRIYDKDSSKIMKIIIE